MKEIENNGKLCIQIDIFQMFSELIKYAYTLNWCMMVFIFLKYWFWTHITPFIIVFHSQTTIFTLHIWLKSKNNTGILYAIFSENHWNRNKFHLQSSSVINRLQFTFTGISVSSISYWNLSKTEDNTLGTKYVMFVYLTCIIHTYIHTFKGKIFRFESCVACAS